MIPFVGYKCVVIDSNVRYEQIFLIYNKWPKSKKLSSSYHFLLALCRLSSTGTSHRCLPGHKVIVKVIQPTSANEKISTICNHLQAYYPFLGTRYNFKKRLIARPWCMCDMEIRINASIGIFHALAVLKVFIKTSLRNIITSRRNGKELCVKVATSRRHHV